MKRIIAVILIAMLCLTACTRVSDSLQSSVNSETESFTNSKLDIKTITPENTAKLIKSAEILTEHLVLTLFDLENPLNGFTLPLNDGDIARFVIATVIFMDNKEYLYNNFFYLDEEGYWRFPETNVNQLIDEVLGVKEWEFKDISEVSYDADKKEFSVIAGFGIGNNLELRNTETAIDAENSEVSVVYEIHTNSEFSDSKELGTARTRFAIMQNEDRLYLRYIETTAV